MKFAPGAIALWLLLAVSARTELDSALYVWQFDWTESVREAVRVSDSPASSFMVLTSEWSVDDANRLQQRDVPVDWSVFTGEVVPVVRMNGSLAAWVENQTDALVRALKEQDASLRSAAARHDIKLGPLQIDYDCPTARLPAYRRLLQTYGGPVTITTLPTWLSSDDFAPLVRETSGYVLQLHSLEPPRSPTELGAIFSRTPGAYIDQASAIGVPFHIALPTYGYAYYFDSDGAFKRLAAEDTDRPWLARPERRILMADPVRVAATVRDVLSSPPPHCLGITWFRMPVEGDQLNWHRKTLQTVMTGEAPRLDVRAELKESDGRWECWVTNAGTADPWGQTAQFVVSWSDGYPLAMQGLGNFFITRHGQQAKWIGPAPRVGSPPQLAGWMRFADGDLQPTVTPVQIIGGPTR